MNLVKRIVVFLIVAASLLSFSACGGDDGADTPGENADMTLDYSDVDAADFVRSITYKGLTVTLADKNASRETALWDSILATAETGEIPEDKAMYYFQQTKDYYMYFAGDMEKDYEYVLRHFGTDETKMMNEAKELVKKDLVYLYIVNTEGIALTDGEKTELFDKYVDKYVSDYSYNRDYVLANMTDIIYESMLYDKTMEFLIANNTFVVQE